jgi:hypothetical protein
MSGDDGPGEYRFGEELRSVDEVARQLASVPMTIYCWRWVWRLPCVKLGNVWRGRRAAYEAI